MDEAGAAPRLVQALGLLRRIGHMVFSGFQICAIHIIAYNLHAQSLSGKVLKIMMQVAFLEVALSILRSNLNGLPLHPDSLRSWADLLNMGYVGLVVDGVPMLHALWLGIGLIALVVLTATAISKMVEAR